MEHMELVDFCGLLGMNGEAGAACRAYAWEADAVQEAYRLLYGRPARFFHRLSAGTQVPQRSLALYVQFAQMLWPVYRQWGIPKEIYLDTFSDIALWEREYFEAHGAHGLTETEWLAHHVRMEIFRLGSLQFQPQKEPLEEVWKSAGIDGTEMVLNVHIPKGADLDTGAVRQSYVRALDFWGCGSAVLLCESWLLSPQLGELLPQKSRIRSFAKEFYVIAVEESSRQAEERIFGAVKADPRDYPENGTSLQLAARRHLITGGSLPAGFGWQKIVKP